MKLIDLQRANKLYFTIQDMARILRITEPSASVLTSRYAKKNYLKGFLNKLIFGGGTALRLFFGLNRYSVNLDSWARKGFTKTKFQHMGTVLEQHYRITDCHEKHFSYLLENGKHGFKILLNALR